MKPRGSGSVYRRGGVWWIKFYDRTGRARRESSGSEVKSDAEKVLRKRLGEVASGKRLIGTDLAAWPLSSRDYGRGPHRAPVASCLLIWPFTREQVCRCRGSPNSTPQISGLLCASCSRRVSDLDGGLRDDPEPNDSAALV
jgi:hypothetical protein